MRKAIGIGSILLATLLTSSTLALAEDASTSAVRPLKRLEEMQKERELRQTEKRASDSARFENRKELIAEKQAKFKEKLAEIKDANKQRILEKLEASYANINKRWTDHFTNVLDRLAKIADKMKLRGIAGLDPIYVQIESAQTAVDAQAAKTYVIEITDETELRTAAQTVHAQLKADLKALRDQIQAIRDALHALNVTVPSPTP